MISRFLLSIGTALAAAAGTAEAQPPHPAPPEAASQPPAADTDAGRAAAVDRLAAMLEESYVFPDIGRRYAEALRRKAAAGGYANAGDPVAFARTVTADLQAVHPDLHLRVLPAGAGPTPRLGPPPGPGPGPAGASGHRLMLGGPDAAAAVGRTGWIADGVAYIELTLFPGTDESIARISRVMAEYRNARAIIFDIRGHHGGGPAEMDVIFSYLFGRETLLVGMDTRIAAERMGVGLRRDGPPGGVTTLRPAAGPDGVVRRLHYAVPGPDTPLRRAQVFLLTSHRTGSAAEHFSLALKRTHRAILIGEATAGANHFGRMVELGGYTAFLPVGRTFDPDTDRDWEGVGVAPDIAVPADQALDEALRRLGVTPAQRRELAPPRRPPRLASMDRKDRPLWRCGACGRSFANPGQSHACGRYALAPHFAGRSLKVRAIYDAFRTMLEGFGPVIVLPEKTRIAFQVRMSFAQLTIRRDWVLGHLVLARRAESPLFTRVETFSPRNHLHAFRLDAPEQVEALADFAREAYAVGRQEHLGQGGFT